MSATTKKKHVEKELTEDFIFPSDKQIIAKIIRPRGNNLHQVITSSNEDYLVSMPPKFRKHIWIKRGDYVLLDPISEGYKVQGEIVRILHKEHINYLKANEKWPLCFIEENSEERARQNEDLYLNFSESSEESDNEEFKICNPNRKEIYIEETESSEESDSESSNSSNYKQKR